MEATFEAAIEHNLITEGGYISGNPETFDSQLCLDPTILISFIQETSPKNGNTSRTSRRSAQKKPLFPTSSAPSTQNVKDASRYCAF
jgi:hypothetical protein